MFFIYGVSFLSIVAQHFSYIADISSLSHAAFGP